MGFSKFKKFYYNFNNQNEKSLTSLSGKIVIVDAYQQLHRMLIGKIGYSNNLSNTQSYNIKNEHIHVYMLYNFTCKLITQKIIPFFVFDGGVPDVKTECIKNRNNIKQRASEKLDTIDDKNSKEAIKQKKKCVKITFNMIRECIEMLELMGIGYVVAPDESDGQLAVIYNYFSNPRSYIKYKINNENNITCNINISSTIGGIISDDTDILAFGGKKLLKDFSFVNNFANEITIENILKIIQKKSDQITEELNLPKNKITFNDFLNFSILMGTNYNQRIDRIFFCADVENLFKLFIKNNLNVRNTVEIMCDQNIKKKNITDVVSVSSLIDEFMINFENSKKSYKNSKVYDPANIDILPYKCKVKQLRELIFSLSNYDTISINKMRFMTNVTKQINNVNYELENFMFNLLRTYTI